MAKKVSPRTIATAERTLERFDTLKDDLAKKDVEALKRASQAEGDTRNELARNFMRWYFWILVLLLVGIPVYNLVAHQVTGDDAYMLTPVDMIQTYTSVVGPLFGFVIAYYFKNKNDNN